MRILNCINLYSINLYINFEKNSSMGKKAPDHDNLSYEEENYYISEFMNIILKNRMNLNELNKMLYEIDVKLKSLEKGYGNTNIILLIIFMKMTIYMYYI